MTEPSRRDLGPLALGGLAVAALSTLPALPAAAYQGNMERSLSALYSALASLREATPNKGGHRERAIDLIRQAIGEVEAGIAFADEHGGGGPTP
ncbi:hypothetical protein NVS89_03785 [Ancylobacter sp. MQZ15Z-1]|uniref:Uncharacterized protein n=1 Tax=Ancylobacter mangrovi TaxID=2972472 RepID=A0A9X2PDX6_9HYPH|nr:hypothetical protein [Ancylobacter mangrovi]MCS0494205.1 hypothetical protein [Ancylobacter mangrovi]